MENREHAVLSASSSHRWLACPPSALLEDDIEDVGSEFAAEGSLAHAIGEVILRYNNREMKKPEFNKRLEELKQDKLYQNEMLDYIEVYQQFVFEKCQEAKKRSKDYVMHVEQRLDFSRWVPDGFGTGDAVIISDNVIEVIDLKYGKGVPVSAEDNPQMKLYALGAIAEFEMLYDLDLVKVHIVQPRLDSISSWEIPVKDLLNWADKELKPIADLASKGEGEFKAGEHCRFCKIKARCRARAEVNLETAIRDFDDTLKDPKLLTNEEIADLLNKTAELKRWAGDIEEFALDQAVNHGIKWDGWKLVEGRSNRAYSDKTKVAELLEKEGFEEEKIYSKDLLGITAMEKSLGKKIFEELLCDLVIKPAGKPVLAPLGDKRPEINSSDSAMKDFAEDL